MSLPKPYYQDDAVTIYHGDCRDIIPHLPPVELLLTDVPYGEVNRTDVNNSHPLYNINKGVADVMDVDLATVYNIECNTAYVFCGLSQFSTLREGFVQRAYTTRAGVWEKVNPSPMLGQFMWLSGVELCVYARKKGAGAIFNEFCKNSVWRYNIGSGVDHPTQKPIELFSRLLVASTNPGSLVLDPFMGSGTTLLACKEQGRRAIGIEREEKYCALTAERLAQEVLPL